MAEFDRGGATKAPEAAGHPGSSGGTSAQPTLGSVKAELGGKLNEIKGEARTAASDALRQVTEQVETHKDTLAERFDGVAESVRRSAEAFGEREGWLGDLMQRGASEIEGFANALRTKDLPGLAEQAQLFARRQPAVFAGISVAVGFGLARVARGAIEGSQATGGHAPAYGGNQPAMGYGTFGPGSSSSSFGGANVGSSTSYGGASKAESFGSTGSAGMPQGGGLTSTYADQLASTGNSATSSGAAGSTGSGLGTAGSGTTGLGTSTARFPENDR